MNFKSKIIIWQFVYQAIFNKTQLLNLYTFFWVVPVFAHLGGWFLLLLLLPIIILGADLVTLLHMKFINLEFESNLHKVKIESSKFCHEFSLQQIDNINLDGNAGHLDTKLKFNFKKSAKNSYNEISVPLVFFYFNRDGESYLNYLLASIKNDIKGKVSYKVESHYNKYLIIWATFLYICFFLAFILDFISY
ncbi:MAG: hypothetical protein MK193_06365 [Lentisphaeria bacterium]|nr:hypothetical protein [Lentisphaeria bacterium]